MDAVLNRVSSPTFVGRADELAALEGALGRAAAGVPAFAFIAGESGVGKSRLVAEFAARARAATPPARVLLGHCLELGGQAIPYTPLVEALRPIARDGGGELLPPAVRGALADMLPGFGESAVAADPESMGHQARVFEALLLLLERLGDDGPVVLVLEDLHWADQSTRDFLTFLVRSASSGPLCLVVTYRSDELHRRHPLRPLLAELERTAGVERLGLERFSREEVGAQISAILDEPASPALADDVFERSAGNALYAEELLVASAQGCSDIPDTLRDLLLQRVERLPATAQDVLRIVSVEHPMRHSLLAAMCDLEPADLLHGLREAVAHQVLVAGERDTYAFRHALVGEAVYSDLLPGERSELHLRLAETLDREPELLAGAPPSAIAALLACHWHAAHDIPRALASSVQAGMAAKKVYAYSEAQRHLERALELWDRVPGAAERAGMDRVDLLRHAATAASQSGQTARSVALVRKALDGVDPQADPLRAAYLFERLGHYLRGAGETEAGFEAYHRAMGLLPEGDSVQRARLLEYKSRGMMLRGQFARAVELGLRALAMADRFEAHDVHARALNTLGFSRGAMGELEIGLDLLRRSRDVSGEIANTPAYVQATTNLSELLDASGRTEEALAEVRACLEVLRSRPERTTYDTFLEIQGVNHLIRLGRFEEIEPGLPTEHFGDERGTTPLFLQQLRAWMAVRQGDMAAARTAIAELRRLSPGTVEPQWIGPLHSLIAEVALLEDRPEDARASVAQGLATIDGSEDGGRTVKLIWFGLMAEAAGAEKARALGEPFDETVAEGLLAALEAAEQMPAQWVEGPLHAALARAEASRMRFALGTGEPDPAAWERIADAFEGYSWPWPAAYARYRAGEAHVQLGDRASAAAPLTAARESAAALGAAPLLGEIDALARRARVTLAAPTPDEPETAEPPSPAEALGLTPRELEVLLLVAAGRTNREIGAELFMSEKTASVHVSRILAKFGVGGRVEAAAVAHRLGLTAALT